MPEAGSDAARGTPYPGAPSAAAARRDRRWIVGLGVVASAIVAWFAISFALFDDTDDVGANTFDTTDCFQPRLNAVQTGMQTVTAAGDVDVAITAVDPASAFVIATQRSDSGAPPNVTVAVQLTSATNLRFTKSPSAVETPVVVEWSVVEYDCGVSVQHGLIAAGSTSPIAISSVEPGRAFVLFSLTAPGNSSFLQQDDLYGIWISSPTELSVVGDLASGSIAYQVVEFQPGAASVQNVAVDLTGLATRTATLPTAVDPDRTFVLGGWTVTSHDEVDDFGVRTRLVDQNTIEATRLGIDTDVDLRVQVVELADGTVVRHGLSDLAPGESTTTASFEPVTVARSTMFATGQASSGQSLGRGELATDDNLGDVSFTFELTSPTDARLTRDSTVDDASVAWQVVEWGGPPWWDGDWAFRRRLDVDATVLAEQRYSVPLTIDHAQLVADGFSSASGDDIRVLRWDGTTWTELDRILGEGSAWNAADTTLWFRTTDDIAAGGAGTYWLYHRNGAAPAPPADPEQVWLVTEDFEDGTLGDFVDRTPGAWYAADPWTRRRPITVSAASVPSDLTDFPLLVELTDADLAANAQWDGDDIRFVAADGTTPLAHEIERWDSSTGALTAWVRIPLLSASVDTTIYLLYSAPNAPDQSDVDAVWDDAVAIWHLAEDPSGPQPDVDDSGPGDREGLALGSMTSGDLVDAVAGDGLDFDGSDDRIDVAGLELGAVATISAWVRTDTLVPESALVAKASSPTDPVFELALANGGATGRQLRGRVEVGGSIRTVQAADVNAGAWYHVALVYDGTAVRLVVDGVEVATTSVTGALPVRPGRPVTLGGLDDGSWLLDGHLDEVRVLSAARTVDWLSVEHANQGDPGSFLSFGSVETGTWLGQGEWSHRLGVGIDGAAFTADLTDQPVPLRIAANGDLATLAQTGGADLVVTAGDGVTRLDHEVEWFDPTSGEALIWVRVPSVATGTSVLLFLYVGNPSAVDQQDPDGVFGPTAESVWHLANDGNLLLNGSFEAPFVADSSFVYADPPGWTSSRPDGSLEIQGDGLVVPALAGRQIAELNVSAPRSITQSVVVEAGATYEWSFHHRGRTGVDTVEVLVDGLSQGSFATDASGWRRYSGQVVATSAELTLVLSAVSPTGDSGNLIDDVQLRRVG